MPIFDISIQLCRTACLDQFNLSVMYTSIYENSNTDDIVIGPTGLMKYHTD